MFDMKKVDIGGAARRSLSKRAALPARADGAVLGRPSARRRALRGDRCEDVKEGRILPPHRPLPGKLFGRRAHPGGFFKRERGATEKKR
jgi:hypothetical protein